ncbi:ABC transporter substrate-binding protein [Azospirillum sp. TSH58]|uniref:substrate-binding periplasmic protein n=1 Tax=Azospirillum sp. TSH58 TaxID=664962 RepID=UPI0013A52E48|nr:transporter substrate-binding domain-containing protein [Azospirillum sp. TSH58]
MACSFDAAPFKQIIDDVAAGRYDIASQRPAHAGPRAAAAVLDSLLAIEHQPGRAAGHARTGLEDAVRSRRIAAIRGSRQHAALLRLADADPALQANVVPVLTLEDLWEAMRSGQSDMAIGPTLNVVHFLLSDSGDGFETIGTPMSEDGLGGTVHIVFPPGRQALKESVDRALTALRNDGTYQRINRNYFPFDIY